MELKELHEKYGQLTIQAEIIRNQLIEIKKMIAVEMNKQGEKPAEKKES